MKAKVFDPMDDGAVQAWLRRGAHKEIVTASVYKTWGEGVEHEVGIVLYVEERVVPDEMEDEERGTMRPFRLPYARRALSSAG
ncbi:MAG TPA: hypothetical protein VF166_08920 [Gemmatimonadaceae bacterium]